MNCWLGSSCSSAWYRKDRTLKPDCFIPHPYPDLSMTRHWGLSESALWQIGQATASARPATLYGRADLKAAEVRRQSLQIDAAPLPESHPREHNRLASGQARAEDHCDRVGGVGDVPGHGVIRDWAYPGFWREQGLGKWCLIRHARTRRTQGRAGQYPGRWSGRRLNVRAA